MLIIMDKKSIRIHIHLLGINIHEREKYSAKYFYRKVTFTRTVNNENVIKRIIRKEKIVATFFSLRKIISTSKLIIRLSDIHRRWKKACKDLKKSIIV